MSQPKSQSLLEVCCNTASAFVISVCVWTFVISPIYGIKKDFTENIGIVGIFTVISIVRSYCWRRLFNTKGEQR